VRDEFRHDHRIPAAQNPFLSVHRHALLPRNGQEEKVVADPPLRNVPRPETVPEGDAEHDRFRIENDPRGRLRRLRIKQPFELQLAFVAEFIHSVENRKKRLVFCNCFLLENSV